MSTAPTAFLLLTYPSASRPRPVREVAVREAMVQAGLLTSDGWRSLVFQSKRKGWISDATTGKDRQLLLSTQGSVACERLFPALDPAWQHWDGRWLVVLFTHSPTVDPQFRQLRLLLLRLSAVPLTRGAYFVPSLYQWELLALTEKYSHSVSVALVENWLRGDPAHTIMQHFDLSNLAQTYSGIGDECRRLLEQKKQTKKRAQQQKAHFLAVFSRFWEVLGEDRGVLPFFLPNAPTARTILTHVQQAFDQVFVE